jgi:hypothetical protein
MTGPEGDPRTGDDYGFTVTSSTSNSQRQRRWSVYLPAQPGAWDITGGGLHRRRYYVAQPEAVARLEAFIREAQTALDALRAGRETGVQS